MPIKKGPITQIVGRKSVQIRSLKEGDWYWIARSILRTYGKRLGPSGIAVYNALACYSDSKTQGCFPTRKTVARVLGLSRKTVSRKIDLLQKLRLILVEKTGNSYRYYLLETTSKETYETYTVDKQNLYQRTLWPTNNNQLSRVNNNNKQKGKIIKASKRFSPKSKEELLALDLATALNDRENLSVYLSYARKYSEQLLRRILGEVKEVPANKLKKGRVALFKYLLQKHAHKTFKNSGG